jgi:hypothetical protein
MKTRIILFDDVPKNRDEVLGVLNQALGKEGEVQLFDPGKGGLKEGTHEKRLAADLAVAPNAPASLIIADRDLSGYSDDYRGLSESTVRLVADDLGIPECGYARGERDDDPSYIERGEQRESCIRLSLRPDIGQFAKQAVAIAEGFAQISGGLTAALKESSKKSPGKLLASILGKPEYADKISLFASGDQNRLAALASVRAAKDEPAKERRLACFLGYWLWDSILRFPGVVANEVAASSYLNIHQEDFQKTDLQDLFREALYGGPFAGAKEPLWWRGKLDDIISTSGCSDGKVYAEQKLKRALRQSECCEDPSKSAGYYCFLSKRPVSLERSKAGLPWFPRGADLARVSLKAYEELGPWL